MFGIESASLPTPLWQFPLIRIRLSGSAARGAIKSYLISGGGSGNALIDPANSSETTSFGGYLQFDIGSVLMDQGLILGFGMHRTEWIKENQDEEFHDQYAAYVAYPFGFNNSLLKLVASRADGERYIWTGSAFDPPVEASTYAVRLRYLYHF